MTRVSKYRGNSALLIIAPHGNQEDDINTDIIANVISTKLNAYHVINTGWKRAKEVNTKNNLANLNNINHCKKVRSEFLDPILSYKTEIISRFSRCHIFHIHGMANDIRTKTGDNVDIVLGYGAGNPSSYSCGIDYKNAFITRLREENFNVYQGKEGGKFSAWKRENLNQYFRQHNIDQRVQSVQLEIVNLRRYDIETATETGLFLARAISKFLYEGTKFNRSIEIKEF